MKTRIIYVSICIIPFFSLSGQAQEKTTVLTKAEKEQAVEKITEARQDTDGNCYI